ncbi:cytochrome P450 [Zychaea mexicana]|uniref:cytochrome P450 n=1 Tax=Zychaea mexicana TaxID=64656 RepID=UPI0022FF2D94|nr:cytochrome P450 [Zychaea mexicana]KAI9484646.1 cytochrome P450 [Zychaea mexicana]
MKPSTAITILKNTSVDFFKFSSPYAILMGHYLERHPRKFVLTVGLLTLAYKISKAVVVPPRLWHLPRVSSIAWFWSIIKGESVDVRSERLLMSLMDEHGLCLKYQMGRWTVTVGDPTLLQEVLKDVRTFPKQVNASLDPDLILTNPEPNMGNSGYIGWRRQRRVANPVFHRAMPVQVFGNIVSTMFAAIDAEKTADIDFADYMRRYALDCLGLGVFNFDMGAVRDPESPYAVLYKHAFSIVRDPLVYLFPAYTAVPSRWIPYRNRARIANEKLRRILYDIIQERKDSILANPEEVDEHKDLLTLMIEASLITGEHGDNDRFLTNGELVANLAVFFVAGHETTASATASTMYYLAEHPDMQERARQEVISVLGDAYQDILPTADQLRQMPFLNNCIKETMRINPPTSGNLPRIAACDTHIGHHFIPEGTPIAMELYCAHHLNKYWPNPNEFNPDRFSGKHGDGGIDTDSNVNNNNLYIPFGYGPRACIGMNFSLAEQRVVQAMMLRKYTWELVPLSEHRDGLKNAKSGGIGLLGPDRLQLRLMKRY